MSAVDHDWRDMVSVRPLVRWRRNNRLPAEPPPNRPSSSDKVGTRDEPVESPMTCVFERSKARLPESRVGWCLSARPGRVDVGKVARVRLSS